MIKLKFMEEDMSALNAQNSSKTRVYIDMTCTHKDLLHAVEEVVNGVNHFILMSRQRNIVYVVAIVVIVNIATKNN